MEKVLNADDRMMLSDRLENAEAVISFVADAAACLIERGEPVNGNCTFGMNLTMQYASNLVESVREFIMER